MNSDIPKLRGQRPSKFDGDFSSVKDVDWRDTCHNNTASRNAAFAIPADKNCIPRGNFLDEFPSHEQLELPVQRYYMLHALALHCTTKGATMREGLKWTIPSELGMICWAIGHSQEHCQADFEHE
jgi:hypothetical protein